MRLAIDVIVVGYAVTSFGTFFSMPWRLLAFPIAAGMAAHASTLGADLRRPAKCADRDARRLHLPFAAVASPALYHCRQAFFLFNAATGLVELISIASSTDELANSNVTAFLIIMAMTFGLILPRLLFESLLPTPI